MQLDLDERVFLVTGAAAGVGRAVAVELAKNGARSLALTDRDGDKLNTVAEELAAQGVTCEPIIADLLHPEAPGQIVGAALARFGGVDGLINAAGLTNRATLVGGTQQDWDMLFAVNSRAPFFLMQGVVTDLLARKSAGTIVNILSVNTHCGPPDLAIYSASKGALLTLTKNAANAHMADKIRVNGINLGWAQTEGEEQMQAEVLGLGPGWIEDATRNMPLKRLLQPPEVARLAVYLSSDASAPLSGVAIDLEQKVLGIF